MHGVYAIESMGIKLIPGAFGDVKDVIKAYKEGTLTGNPDAMHECSHGNH